VESDAFPTEPVRDGASAGDRVRASSAGFQLHVSKPFDPVELARIVQRLAVSAARQ